MALAGFFGRSVHELVRPDAANIELEEYRILRTAVDSNLSESDKVFSAIHQLHEFAVDYCQLEKIAGSRTIPELSAGSSSALQQADGVR